MNLFMSFIFLSFVACSLNKKIIPPSQTLEEKLVYVWSNKSTQLELENKLSIQLNSNLEYEKGMNKIIANFSGPGNNLTKLVFVSYELNPQKLKELIPCRWKENSKVQLIGKTKVEVKESVCAEKNILVKNNEQSYTLWEAWFGF